MKRLIFIFLIAIMGSGISSAQDYLWFSDSPDPVFFDWSWSFISGGSYLERIGEKVPVDTAHFYSGNNSLRMHWKSVSGGDWGWAVAEMGTPWPVHDVTKKDSLSFWVFSNAAIQKVNMPLIYLEDNTNKKTDKVKLSGLVNDIPEGQWTKIQLPLKLFVPGTQGADLTIIKTIFFGQDASDNTEHTLYLDEIRMVSAGSSSDTIPPAAPSNLTAKGYDSHIDLIWTPNTETNLNGYKIYKSDGTNFKLLSTVTKDDHVFTDFVGNPGISGTYKVSAFNGHGVESPMSLPATATTIQLDDEKMLDMLEEASFRYFWDYAHPVSGMARERTGSGKTVTTGGTGFGVMAIMAAIERGFITRDQGVQRMKKMVTFLVNTADRFHGAFSHWLNGETGKVIPFSQYDDGGDLVETSFLMQGLLAARQYFNQNTTDEYLIRTFITSIWESVEYDWYRRDTTYNVLFWHWSPNFAWQMNFPLVGWNETMITYLLAIASPKHSIPPALYKKGWQSSNQYANGKSFYGIPLYVGWDYGGPLFFAHYSFLGFDPRGIKDSYCNYFINNRNATLINRAYCMANPKKYPGYDKDTWGLTASDDPFGYSAHQPLVTDDNGTITPTAALSSMPYTPTESISAFKNFYHKYGAKLWGPYGFKDAFNLQMNWFDNNYLAIDQGPIVAMVENYRSSLIWKNFMANAEIAPMLQAIGFVKDTTSTDVKGEESPVTKFQLLGNYPNPFNPSTTIKFSLPLMTNVEADVFDLLGRKVKTIVNTVFQTGQHEIVWNGTDDLEQTVASGIYIYWIKANGQILSGKMILKK